MRAEGMFHGGPARAALVLASLLGLAMPIRNARAVDLQQFKPAPGADDLLAVESPRIGEPNSWHALAGVGYADRPFRLVRIGGSRTIANVIGHQTSLDVGAAWTWRRLLEAGIVVPLTLNQTVGHASAIDPALPSSVPATALGDVRLVAKAPIASFAGLDVAAALPLSLPTARADSFLGHRSVTGRPRLLLGRAFGRLYVAGDLGLALRAAETFRNVEQASAVEAGLGGAIPFRLAGQRFEGLATLQGEWGLVQHGPEERPLEALGALRWKRDAGAGGYEVTVGAGHGLSAGAGTPDYRVFALLGARFEGPPPEMSEPPPEPEEVQVVRPRNRILITSPVHFATGRDIILEESFPILKKVAATIAANPWIHRIRVEGHTDNQGDPKYNLDLSQLRAISVARFLVEHGVDPDILVPIGYGMTRPIDTNDTAAGRARNRRVDFVILETDEGVTEAGKTDDSATPAATPTPATTPAPAP